MGLLGGLHLLLVQHLLGTMRPLADFSRLQLIAVGWGGWRLARQSNIHSDIE